MMKRFSSRLTILAATAVFLLLAAARAQETAEKRPLPIDEYERWRGIGSTSLSPDGRWATFAYTLRETDDEFHIKSLETDKEYRIDRGSRPAFSDDSKWAAYAIGGARGGRGGRRGGRGGRGGEAPAPAPSGAQAQLLNLADGEKLTWEGAASFSFAPGGKVFVVRKRKADADAEHDGVDLIVRYLEKGYEEPIGSVGDFSFNKSGDRMAYVIDAADRTGNGVYLLDLTTGARRPLDQGKFDYARMTWDEEGRALAALRGTTPEGMTQRENVLLAFTGIDSGEPTKIEFKPGEAFGFPNGFVVSDLAGLTWSEGGDRIFFAIKEQSKETDESDEPVADVDIFHWKDDRIQSVQRSTAQRDRNFTWRAALDLTTKKFARLTDETMRSIDLTRDGKWGVGQDDRKYVSDWKEARADYYRVDAATGERTLMLQEQGRTLGLSPDSKHFLYWKDGHVWNYVLDAGESRNLTESAPVSFADMEWDYVGTRPPYGVAGWTSDGGAVILEHRYDLYLQPLDGSATRNLTGGVGDANEMRLRYIRTDPEARTIDLSEPILLSAYGEWTKKSGFYELRGGEMKELIYEDRRFGSPDKAKGADRYSFTVQTFREYPDYYVSDGTFAAPRRITDANPQQIEYQWGRRILFDYANKDGVRLQGTLAIPDDYIEGERRPMLVNFYEKNSQNLHGYPTPRHASSPNFAGYVSNGYLVMQPDVHFTTGPSHDNMLDCVEAAVKKVIEMGYADPERVGLHGHSYSGGGAAYISTRSKMFAAVVAGAAPINLVGEFNIIFRGSGQNNHRYDIHGQGRYGVSPYDGLDLLWSQSPIAHIQELETPVLYLHGTNDQTVEYNQGLEFYNAARFLGKPVIFLSYNGEGHGLRRRENQIDFQRRVREFFDRYLKGKSAPEWMTRGVPFLKRDR